MEWFAADTDEGSFAQSIAPADHWDLRDLVAVVSRRPKVIGSTEGHDAAVTSPLMDQRLGVGADAGRLAVERKRDGIEE